MKRTIVALAIIALVVGLLPGFLAGPILAQSAPITPDAVAPLGTPQYDDPEPDETSPGEEAALPAPDAVPPAQAFAAEVDQALIAELRAAAGPGVQLSAHAATGRARFLGGNRAAGFAGVPTGLRGGAEAAARGFLDQYGALFGLADGAELQTMRSGKDGDRSFVRLQQLRNGVPVLAGELIVQTDDEGRVWSASGEAAPDALPVADPAISPELAAREATDLVAKHYERDAAGLTASTPELWYYVPALLGAPGPGLAALVWRVEVKPAELAPIRELVLVDALSGKVVLNFNQVNEGKYRIIYNNQNNRGAGLPGWGPVRTEGQGPTGDNDANLAYDYAGDTYDFFLSRFGRDSIDGAGMAIISTVKYCDPDLQTTCPFDNAFWEGTQMVYGQDYASADDVVAHELTHGVTDFESQLFYYMQSGALNESLSDIFGEFVDLTNGKGDDSPSVRWLMGEDMPIGEIRDMANPPAFQDPDRVGSSYYYCGTSDRGGVHWNSGVPNKATYLMTDGGSFRGVSVTGLGVEKVARIWYRAATQMFTSAAEFQDVYDLLPQSCTDLAAGGVAGITPADCQEVVDALTATEMNKAPALCASTEAPVCDAGQNAATYWSEDFENWGQVNARFASSSASGPNPWYFPQTSNPYGLSDLHYATSGAWHLWGDDREVVTDGRMEMTVAPVVPATGNAFLRFRHAYQFERSSGRSYDGGVLEYSANGGPWTDAGSLMTHNSYPYPINSVTNPLHNRSAFGGVSYGYLSTRLNLNSFRGQSLRFRWRVGTDNKGASWGWFVDDVRFYTCTTPASPTPTATPTRTSTPTPTPTRTPSAPWINWADKTLPPLAAHRGQPVVIQYGVLAPSTNIAATLSGKAMFDDGMVTQTKTAPSRDGTVTFYVLPAPGSASGQAYSLEVKMGATTIKRNGVVGWPVRLPILLR